MYQWDAVERHCGMIRLEFQLKLMTIQCVSVGGEQAGKLNGSRATNQRSIVIVQAGGHIGVYEGGNYLGDGT